MPILKVDVEVWFPEANHVAFGTSPQKHPTPRRPLEFEPVVTTDLGGQIRWTGWRLVSDEKALFLPNLAAVVEYVNENL